MLREEWRNLSSESQLAYVAWGEAKKLSLVWLAGILYHMLQILNFIIDNRYMKKGRDGKTESGESCRDSGLSLCVKTNSLLWVRHSSRSTSQLLNLADKVPMVRSYSDMEEGHEPTTEGRLDASQTGVWPPLLCAPEIPAKTEKEERLHGTGNIGEHQSEMMPSWNRAV
ncbi:hypothetical protein P7K49_001504 [Saguinus oedipus]|uniref:Uncharacterized protein n=1 Tax=Saguinus oedipus TaxID=9490 RepID=A0ABQ9WEN3_SAGOE|nr:hypothetical protein P7K49_001504 [Saguinus oedipus]